ncbi:unnamed protein product [Pylaiella littoralis]
MAFIVNVFPEPAGASIMKAPPELVATEFVTASKTAFCSLLSWGMMLSASVRISILSKAASSRWYSVSGCVTRGKPTDSVVLPCLASIKSSCLRVFSQAEASDM